MAGEPCASGSLISRDNNAYDDSIYEGAPALQRLLVMADNYKRSFPGNVESAANVAIDSAIYRLQNPARSGPMSDRDIRWLTDHLSYRISMTKLVTSYKNFMGISFVDCQDIDAGLQWSKVRKGKDEQASMHIEKCRELVSKHYNGLFGGVRMHRVPTFGKMVPYLALVLHSTNWTTDEMEAALMKCEQYKIDTSDSRRIITPLVLAQYPVIQELVSQPKVKRLRDVDSDSVPPRKSRVPWKHLQGTEDARITTPSPHSRRSLEGPPDDTQGYHPSRRLQSDSPGSKPGSPTIKRHNSF